MQQWWQRVGNTPSSGLTKLVMSEASNFPELAAFYQQEVLIPGQELIRRILKRGVDHGEFVLENLDYGVFTVLAPMIFLITWKHSFGALAAKQQTLAPETYLDIQVQTILHGLCRPQNIRSEPVMNQTSTQKAFSL